MNLNKYKEMPPKDVEFERYATAYDPIKIGSIDGTDERPHDRALLRALTAEYKPNQAVRGDPRRTVFIGRLHPKTTQDTVKSEFSQCGRVLRCRLVRDLVTGRSKQYAFVEYQSGAEVERALLRHGDYIDNVEILVEREAERSLVGWVPRRLGGGLGGARAAGQLRFGGRARPFRPPIRVGADGQ